MLDEERHLPRACVGQGAAVVVLHERQAPARNGGSGEADGKHQRDQRSHGGTLQAAYGGGQPGGRGGQPAGRGWRYHPHGAATDLPRAGDTDAMRVGHHVFEETPDALLARAKALSVSDDRAERMQKHALVGCAVSGVLAMIVFFAGILLGGVWYTAMNWAVPTAAILAFGGIVGGIVVYAWYRRYDLDDRKVATLRTVVTMLRADVPSAGRVHVDVDFRDYRKGRLVRKEGGFFSSHKSYVYAHPWLTVESPLADGSRLRLSVDDHVKRKEKSKRKWTKVRESARSRVAITLRLGKGHADAAAVAARLQATSAPAQSSLLSVQARGRTLAVALRSRPAGRVNSRRGGTDDAALAPTDGESLLQMLRWVYGGLAASARETA